MRKGRRERQGATEDGGRGVNGIVLAALIPIVVAVQVSVNMSQTNSPSGKYFSSRKGLLLYLITRLLDNGRQEMMNRRRSGGLLTNAGGGVRRGENRLQPRSYTHADQSN